MLVDKEMVHFHSQRAADYISHTLCFTCYPSTADSYFAGELREMVYAAL